MGYNFGRLTLQMTAKLDAVQRRATKMIPSLRNKSYVERLARLNLFSLEKRCLQEKHRECFKILKGLTNVNENKQFLTDDLSQIRSNGVKLRWKQIQIKLN